ncbi:T9SS type A sorting domain-containing protein [Flavobacterium sp.]|uniref:T9SS type A sorting domain-containing protein n=1 Tax=Flavobacterium sp. TaxID=239 RepID=UPI003C62EC29
MKNNIIFYLFLLTHVIVFGQVAAPLKMPIDQIESEFFTDNSTGFPAGQRVTLLNNAGDDSSTLNTAINFLNNLGGGVITINAGTWEFAEILMKSNIHLVISKDAIIKPSACPSCVNKTTNRSIFRIGSINATFITENVSIRSLNDDGQFTIDLSDLEMVTDEGVAYLVRITPFNMKAVTNFMVSGCRVVDNFTVHAAMNCSVSKSSAGVWGRPKQGLIKNLTVQNAHSGYGAVQVRSGEKLLFKNITSVGGGVSLRIETDDVTASGGTTPQEEAWVSEISAYNIKCANGNAAVMIQPWSAQNGWFDVQKIEATSCMAAVRIDKAYDNASPFIGVGVFDSDSRITDVTCSYGTNAQVKEGVFPWVPCVLRTNPSILIYPGIAYMDDGSYHLGPLIAPLLYRASTTSGAVGNGYYSVNVPTENQLKANATGFDWSISLVISRDNNRVNNCPALSNESFAFNTNQVKVYPNPFESENEFLTIDLVTISDVSITISDLMGKLVYSNNFKGQSKVEINLSKLNLAKGTYVVNAKSDIGMVSKKIIVL